MNGHGNHRNTMTRTPCGAVVSVRFWAVEFAAPAGSLSTTRRPQPCLSIRAGMRIHHTSRTGQHLAGGTDAYECRTDGDLRVNVPRFFCHDGVRRILAWDHPDGTRIVLPPEEIDHIGDANMGRTFKADGKPLDICHGWAKQHPDRVPK